MFKSKHLSTFVFMAVAILAGGTLAYGVQGPNAVNTAITTSGSYAPGHLDSQGSLYTTNAGASTLLAASGASAILVDTGPGTLITVNVITASGVGSVYDVATAASAATANQIWVIPATAGTYTYNFPYSKGLVVNPSSSVISVSYH